jgi:hypothetical protein
MPQTLYYYRARYHNSRLARRGFCADATIADILKVVRDYDTRIRRKSTS